MAQRASSIDQRTRLRGGLAALRPARLLGAALLLAALALLAGGPLRALRFDPFPDMVDFFDEERNAQIDYRYARPEAALFWRAPLPAGSRLTMRLFSPPPLPARELVVRHAGAELLRLPVGPAPRSLRILLPPGDPALPGYALELRSDPAQAAGDPRQLGLLYDDVRLAAQPPSLNPWPALAAAALILALAGAALLAGLGWPAAGAAALLLALLWRADPGRAWGYGAGLLAALALARLLLPARTAALAARLRGRALSPPAWAALLLALAYAGLFGWYALANQRHYGTNAYDLGLYDQTFWLISRMMPNYSTGAGINMVGSHAALALYPLAAIYALLPDPRLVLMLQVAAVALAVWPLYLLGRQRGRPWLGVTAAAAYLAHPAVQNMALFDFHVDSIAATGLIVALWAAEARRWRPLLAACALVLICKENFAISLAWLGLYLIARGQRRAGAAIALGGVAWFFIATRLIVPALIGQGESLHISRFQRYGSSIGAILLTVVTSPQRILADMLPPDAPAYLLGLLLPLALLPLLSPYTLLAAPALAINLLSSFAPQRALWDHYSALIVAALAVAALDGACRLAGWIGRGGPRAARLAAPALAALLLAASGYGQGLGLLRREAIQRTIAADPALSYQRDYLLALIPPGAGVAAASNLQPHLSRRQQAYLFPNPFSQSNYYNPAAQPFRPQVDYILLDTRRIGRDGAPAEEQLRIFGALQARGLYRRLAGLSGIVLLGRVAGAPDSCYGPGWAGEGCQR